MLADHRRREHGGVPGHRAQAQLAPVDADEVELAEVVDVDDALGLRQPDAHHRQQAVAARDEPRFRAELLEQGQGVLDAGRTGVVDGRRCLHVSAPLASDLVQSPTLTPRLRPDVRQSAPASGPPQHTAENAPVGNGLGSGGTHRSRGG